MSKCKKCNYTGEYFSGYYSHPDTNGYDRYMPIMYKCECVKKEITNELNSHRETKETKNKVIESNLNQIRGLDGFFERECNLHKETKQELEETKDALKIAQEDTRQHKMSLDLADEKEEKIKQYLIKVINYI